MKLALPHTFLIRLWYLPAFILLTVFSFAVFKVDFFPEITFRILFGFIGFLKDTPFVLPFDPKHAWAGLLVFIAVLALVYWLARRKRPSWSIGTSLALLLLPLFLLSAAWFVPRTLLQLNRVTLLPVKNWDRYEPGPRISYSLVQLRDGVVEYAGQHGGAFPESLAGIDPLIHRRISWGDPLFDDPAFDGVTPREQFTYLGAGLRMDSDPALPLLISAPFDWAERPVRAVITVGGEFRRVQPYELDAWIVRALEARRPPPSQPEQKP